MLVNKAGHYLEFLLRFCHGLGFGRESIFKLRESALVHTESLAFDEPAGYLTQSARYELESQQRDGELALGVGDIVFFRAPEAEAALHLMFEHQEALSEHHLVARYLKKRTIGICLLMSL